METSTTEGRGTGIGEKLPGCWRRLRRKLDDNDRLAAAAKSEREDRALLAEAEDLARQGRILAGVTRRARAAGRA